MKLRLLLFCVALAAPVCMAETNSHEHAVTLASAAAATNDPVELEYQKLLELDDAAAEEIDGWIVENNKFEMQGAGVPHAELDRRIDKRREPVRLSYQEFIKRHPGHGRARLAFASFLEDCQDLEGALQQMLKAKEVEPANPAAWNNLANYYGHYGDVTNAFTHYEKAIELDPDEAVYYQNFGSTVYLFRQDAMAYYNISEQQVYDKALMLYSNSLRLDPANFVIATDVAMTYYGIKPTRTDDALKAWEYALKLADGSLQREGVMIHLARFKMNAGRYEEARADLGTVTNAELGALKSRVLRNLELREHPPAELATNAAPVPATSLPPSVAPATNTAPARP